MFVSFSLVLVYQSTKFVPGLWIGSNQTDCFDSVTKESLHWIRFRNGSGCGFLPNYTINKKMEIWKKSYIITVVHFFLCLNSILFFFFSPTKNIALWWRHSNRIDFFLNELDGFVYVCLNVLNFSINIDQIFVNFSDYISDQIFKFLSKSKKKDQSDKH